MAHKQITAGMLRAWEAVDDLTHELMRPPTIYEVMERASITSTSVMAFYYKRGIAEGRIMMLEKQRNVRKNAVYMPAWWYHMVEAHIEAAYQSRHEFPEME
jgi:hypothetical protein